MSNQKYIPPYIQRGLLTLGGILLLVCIGRLLTRMHQLEERLDQLEASSETLQSRMDQLADAAPLPYPSGQQYWHDNARPYKNNTMREQSGYAARGQRDYRVGDRQGYRAYEEGGSHDVSGLGSNTMNTESDTLQATAPASAWAKEGQQPQAGAQSRSNKFSEPRRFNINHIDSLTLIRIPGIAARTASTILKNRERYGGFYDPHQLQDFMTWNAAQAYMEEWCTLWFTADVADVRHIRINQWSVGELQRHPYINHEQAVEIVKYRTRHKRIEKVEELENFPTFTAEDINRLAFYLSFE